MACAREEHVQIGSLVKRKKSEWTKHNEWLSFDESSEVGIIIDADNSYPSYPIFAVMWCRIGLSWEDHDMIEVINEVR